MHITIVYNEPLPSRYDRIGEGVAVASVIESVQAVKQAIASKGHDVTLIGLQPPFPEAVAKLKEIKADVIFNLFEGFQGKPETEWLIAKAIEALGKPRTGSPSEILALCLNKAKTKELLASKGIPTAPYRLMGSEDMDVGKLTFPLIVKPLKEDASHGISSKSVVKNIDELRDQVTFIEKSYGSPVLVEEFLDGLEFNASVLGGSKPTVLPPTQIYFSDDMPGPKILTYSAKWTPDDPCYLESRPVCPAPISEELKAKIEKLAIAAYKAVGSPSYARVDMRANEQGHLYVLEVNSNPDLSPGAGMELQASAAGIQYSDLIEKIIGMAMKEHFLDQIEIRRLRHADVEKLAALTDSTGFFYPEEITVAKELLTESATKGEGSGYFVYVAESGDNLVGYVCFGQSPLTRGTWDIYWIATDPDHQGAGIGTRLLRKAEHEISRKGGRLIVVETSSRELYRPTRSFYLSRGYREMAIIPDFYDVGDGKVIYGKAMAKRGAAP